MQPNDLILKIIEHDLTKHLETRKTEFYLEETDFYKKGKKIDSLAYDIIDSIKETLLKKNILLFTYKKNEDNESITLIMKYELIGERFTFTLLPTKFEIENLNNREKLRQEFFERELSEKILNLEPNQSVTLIDDVLGFEKLPWIKEFKKGKPTRDGGIDFIAKLCIDKKNLIEFDGYGRFFEIYGQLKHLKGKMAEPAMRDLIGTMTKSHSKIKFGMAISSRGFSPDCKRVIDEAVSSKFNSIKAIFCVDIHFISELMIKHKIGLKVQNIKAGLFIDEDWWNEIEIFTT